MAARRTVCNAWENVWGRSHRLNTIPVACVGTGREKVSGGSVRGCIERHTCSRPTAMGDNGN